MEQYLQSYVNYLQDDWAECMPLAEFTADNQVSETMGVSPFCANYGYDLRWTNNPQHEATDKPWHNAANELQCAANNSLEARARRNHAETMKEINKHLQSKMLQAQQRH